MTKRDDVIHLRSQLKFTGIPNIIMEKHLQTIGSNGLSLYAVLKKFADYETQDCYPKIETLANMLRWNRRTVERTLAVLVESKLVLKNSGKDKGSANEYVFILPQGTTPMSQGYDTGVAGGTTPMSHPNKEEVEPINKNQLTKPSASREDELTLHGRIRKYIQERYEKKFKIKCPWDQSEAKMLDRLLEANPSWTPDHWHVLIRNYFDSDTDGSRPRVWLSNISRYVSGSIKRTQPRTLAEMPSPPKAEDVLREQEEAYRRKFPEIAAAGK